MSGGFTSGHVIITPVDDNRTNIVGSKDIAEMVIAGCVKCLKGKVDALVQVHR